MMTRGYDEYTTTYSTYNTIDNGNYEHMSEDNFLRKRES